MKKLLALLLIAASPLVFGQALPNAPAPLPTTTEQELAKLKTVPQVERVAAKFQQEKDWRRYGFAMKRLAELRPHNGLYNYDLAASYAMLDDKRQAYDTLVRLQSDGYAFDIANDKRFEKVHGTGAWDYLVKNFGANAAEFGEGKVERTIPGGDRLIEAIAWDGTRKQLLVGSAREGKVYRVDDKGGLVDYIAADATNGMWSVMDLAVDAPRDLLYVASAAIPHFKGLKYADAGLGGVFKFQLSSGKFLGKAVVPRRDRAQIISSLALTPKGDLFAADGANRLIYRLEGANLTVIIGNPALTSIRGMTVSGDGKTLYFADYELGLFGIDLATGQPFEVKFPKHLSLFSIEGLGWYDNHLVVTQLGFPPKRVMRFKLTADGRAIEMWHPLDVNRKDFGVPGRGVVVGDRFLFLANTQKGLYDGNGAPVTGAKFEPVKVFSSDLKFASKVQQGTPTLKPVGG